MKTQVARAAPRLRVHSGLALAIACLFALHPIASLGLPLPFDDVPVDRLPIRCLGEIAELPSDVTPVEERLSDWCRQQVRLLTGEMAEPVKRNYEACVKQLRIDDGSPFALSLHKECRRLAEGDLEAQYEIGRHFDYGWGVDQDGLRAAEWYQRAAGHGNVKALVALGTLHSGAGPLPANDAKAYEWYRKAAKAGDAFSQAMVANAYVEGAVVPRSYSDAVEWYQRAIEGGYFLAPHHLARLYAAGRGVERDLVQAYAWNSLSASTGNIMALAYQDELERKLTSQQVTAAQRLAKQLDVRFGDRIRKP
ncbi:MAG: sel1 repeat family protein [Proteobacteria bacterium]|nr:sel1 repeat family protein [Pseudomonadota bacterium]